MSIEDDPIMRRYAVKEEVNEDVKTEEVTPLVEKKEEEKAPKVEEKVVENQETHLDFNTRMKELFGTDDVESLKQRISVADKYAEVEDKYKTTQSELEAYQKFVDEAIDPDSYFATKEGKFIENAKMKYPTLDYSTASKLIEKDAKDMSPLEALVLNELVENADVGLSASEAEHIVLQDLGLTKEDMADLDEGSAEYKNLLIKAKKAKRNLASVQEEAKKLPEKQTLVDFVSKHKTTREEAANAVKQAWEPALPTLKEELKQLSIKDADGDVYSYEIPTDWIDGQKEFLMATVASKGLKPDQNGMAEAISNLKAFYLRENAAKVFRAFEKDLRSNWQVETDEKFGTQKPSGITKETVVTQETKTDWSEMRAPRKKFVI